MTPATNPAPITPEQRQFVRDVIFDTLDDGREVGLSRRQMRDVMLEELPNAEVDL